jgi:hypothetical protein
MDSQSPPLKNEGGAPPQEKKEGHGVPCPYEEKGRKNLRAVSRCRTKGAIANT